jgi:chloride channel protein, CIC family
VPAWARRRRWAPWAAGAGTWFARRRALGNEDAQVNTLVGFTGAYGGLFSSTVIVVMLILEAAALAGMAAFLTQVGALQTAPILIAVITHSSPWRA